MPIECCYFCGIKEDETKGVCNTRSRDEKTTIYEKGNLKVIRDSWKQIIG
jgi:hypothetical protein